MAVNLVWQRRVAARENRLLVVEPAELPAVATA